MTPEAINLSTPESRMSLPWVVTNPQKVESVNKLLAGWGLSLGDSLKAFQGGGILKPQEGVVGNPEDEKYLAGDRPIMVIPARQGESIEYNRVVHIPTGEINESKRFDANLAAYRSALAKFVAGRWDKSRSPSPIPQALATGLRDGRFVTVTEFRSGISSLGEGGPAQAVHELNLRALPIEQIPSLVDSLDAIHVPSNEFSQWVEKNKVAIAKESWLVPGNLNCALRGREWWQYRGSADDRWRELRKKIDEALDIYEEVDPTFYFKDGLATMIRNNLDLFPSQNGIIVDKNLVGNLVVVHGTLSPSNIHKKLNPQTGEVNYTVSGGDRSQLYGLRGQMIDWLVAAAAASPDHQKAFIKEFVRRYPSEKERRGLAMHIMYRCISETPWFVQNRKMDEARNLVKLTRDILSAAGNNWEGAWNGVNTPMKTT